MVEHLRILVADDHDLVRRGLINLLRSHEGWNICGEAKTGREAVLKTNELKPHIVILDIGMPELNGLEAARQIRSTCPNTEIMILSVHYSDQMVRELMDAGIRGYVMKSDSNRDLIIALENLANHKPFFTPEVTQALLDRYKPVRAVNDELSSVHGRLTGREREIVQLLAEGKNANQVASSLGISVKTASTHRANLMRKLGIHNVTELVHYALRNQIVEA